MASFNTKSNLHTLDIKFLIAVDFMDLVLFELCMCSVQIHPASPFLCHRQPLEPETAEVVARLIIKLAACTLGTCLGVGWA